MTAMNSMGVLFFSLLLSFLSRRSCELTLMWRDEMYHISLALQCIYGLNNEGGENGDGKEKGVIFPEKGREWKLPGLLCANDFVLCGEWEEDLRAILGRFLEVCRRRVLKVNAGKWRVMVLSGGIDETIDYRPRGENGE